MDRELIDIQPDVISKAILKNGITLQSVVQHSCRNGFLSGTSGRPSPTRRKTRARPASVVAMEECAELAKEISKQIRGSGARTNLLEEMADVTICLKQLQLMYNIPDDDLQLVINQKLARLEGRL